MGLIEVKPLNNDEDPRRLGRYRLIGRLSSGGMGRIYLARPLGNGGAPVAVKTLLADGPVSDTDRRRFAREVELARRVDSAYTARVLDADPDDDRPWMAIEYIPAPALSELVRRGGRLPVPAVRWMGAGIARALVALHEKGIIHRDVKPQNVLLPLAGPRVIDFGISHAYDITRTTLTLGTIAFTSPEQARGEQSTMASDVYSLAATLFFLATGRPPYADTADSLRLLNLVQRCELDLSGLPPELDRLLRPCLAAAPTERPEPDDVLRRCLEGLKPPTGSGSGSRGEQRWLPRDWTALIKAYEAEGRALGQKPGGPASGGPSRPQAQPKSKPPKPKPSKPKAQPPAPPPSHTPPLQPPAKSSSSGGGSWVVAVLIAIAVFIWQPWDGGNTGSNSTSGNSTSGASTSGVSRSGASSGLTTGGSVASSGGTSIGRDRDSPALTPTPRPTPTSTRTRPRTTTPTPTPTRTRTRPRTTPPRPDPTEIAFRNVRAGSCLPVYDTGRGGTAIRWSASVPPRAVPCGSTNAYVRVTRTRATSCPNGIGEGSWSYRTSGQVRKLCLTRIYRVGFCLLGKQSGDRIRLGALTGVNCRSQRVPVGYDRIMHITGVYRAPAGASVSNCRRVSGDQTRYRAWLVNNKRTLLCTKVYRP
ncbi:serine/threonine-protein kinase [Streptomyces apocyni]|uniref:serine/threonine-protein kinase n=1 Tax=Streptomyces apocyni TaxID=2654677 RepID=UPI0018D19D17|nr:serine/threonine-protein kinase [Streptomyces apocyni]